MLCVMVGEYNGFVADSVSRLNATTYRFDTKPKDKIKTIRDYQSEGMLKPALEAMNGAVASMGPAPTAGMLIGGLIGGLMGQSIASGGADRRRRNAIAEIGTAMKSESYGKPTPSFTPREPTFLSPAFELTPDAIEMTGARAGEVYDWTYALATLTQAWVDPIVVMRRMVIDPEVFGYVEQTGKLMREASEKSEIFMLHSVVDKVRALIE